MLIKQKSITSQKLDSQDFQQIANTVLNKGKSAIPPLFNSPQRLSSASGKAKLFSGNFSKNSYLDDSGISLPAFPSRTKLKLHNISVTLMMVKKVILNLDLSKASGPDCILVMVIKNCELQHLIYPRLLTGFGMLFFFTNLSLMEFQVRYFGLISSFLSNGQLQVVEDGKFS